jgi:hypothetical protein
VGSRSGWGRFFNIFGVGVDRGRLRLIAAFEPFVYYFLMLVVFHCSPALYVATNVRGVDESTRIARRNIVRYLVLTQALIFRDISMPVRRRFPVVETLVVAGERNVTVISRQVQLFHF